VLGHALESVSTGFLAQLGKQRDVAAHQRLQAGAYGPEDGSGTDNDASHQAQIAIDSIAIQRKSGGHHVGVNFRQLFFHMDFVF